MTERIDRAWLTRLDAPGRAELESLDRESDPELFAEGLYSLAARQEAAGRIDAALELYGAVANGADAVGAVRERPLRRLAQERIDALSGRGPIGARAEVLLRNLAQQSSDPVMISSMFAAGTIFRMTRLATLSHLASNPTANFLTRGLGARAVANLAGFALEAPAFTLAGRLGSEALGRPQDWSGGALGRDIASSYLVLGGLKLAGWGSGAVYRRFAGPVGAVRERPLQILFQQGGTLSGILLGHALEERLGLRPHQPGATTLIDSLAMLLQFHVAGRIGRSVLGRNFQHWEQGLDRQAEALGSPPIRLLQQLALRPALALAGGGEGPRSNSVFMTMQGGGSKPPLLPGPPRGLGTGRGTLVEPSGDPLEAIRAPRIPRVIRSDSFGDGERIWTYELVSEPLELFLQPGADRVIARRNGSEIRLHLVDSGLTGKFSDYIREGVPSYTFEVQEGEQRGSLTIYVESDRINLFSVRTHDPTDPGREMLPGAGTILIDWVATQAASRRQPLSILAIHEPKIFHMLRHRQIFDPNTAWVEAARYQKPNGYRTVGLGKLTDPDFLYRNLNVGFFNAWGQPHPDLLPPTLWSATVQRGFSSEGVVQGSRLHPYELQISPFRDFLTPGFEGVIARREGRELTLKTKLAELQNRDGTFTQAGAGILDWTISEAGREGKISFYVSPDRFELYSIFTSRLPAGAGGIALDWMATQAALHGKNFGVLYIENPHVVRMLARGRLLEPGAKVQECFHCTSGFDGREVGTLEQFPQVRRNPFADFLLVRGRPNPELIPPEFFGRSRH